MSQDFIIYFVCSFVETGIDLNKLTPFGDITENIKYLERACQFVCEDIS